MIRLYMDIISMRRELKNVNEYNLIKYCNVPRGNNIKCPCCGTEKEFSNDGCYERNIVFINNGNMNYSTIKVKSIRCKICKRSHALLPVAIVPFLSFSIGYMIFLMYDYYKKTYGTVQRLCEVYDISISTLYRIKNLLLRDYEKMVAAFKHIISGIKMKMNVLNILNYILIDKDIYTTSGFVCMIIDYSDRSIFQT